MPRPISGATGSNLKENGQPGRDTAKNYSCNS
jgi:hypothetical protein